MVRLGLIIAIITVIFASSVAFLIAFYSQLPKYVEYWNPDISQRDNKAILDWTRETLKRKDLKEEQRKALRWIMVKRALVLTSTWSSGLILFAILIKLLISA